MRTFLPPFLVFFAAIACCGTENETGSLHFTFCEFLPIYKPTFCFDNFPTCPRDGERIVFYDTWHIWVIPAKGGEARRLTQTRAKRTYLHWCPVYGSNQIVFVENARTGDKPYTIFTMDVDSGNLTAIESFTEEIGYTSWSKDGGTIIFVKLRGEDARTCIYSIPSGGGGYAVPLQNEDGWGDSYILAAQASPVRNDVIYIDRYKSTNWTLNTLSIHGGKPHVIKSFPLTNRIEYLAESFDGQWIACSGVYPSSNMINLFLVSSAGSSLFELTEFIDFEPFRINMCWCSNLELIVSIWNKDYLYKAVPLKSLMTGS